MCPERTSWANQAIVGSLSRPEKPPIPATSTSSSMIDSAASPCSLCFYEQTIGLAIYREWGAGASRGVVFFLGGGGLLEVSGESPPQTPSSAIGLVLQVRDVAATRERLRERGVVVEGEPELKPWGLLEMTVRDPDGLALIFVEVPPGHPRRRA
jgi:predicted enzyme related to lactoylglutathione lyase